MNFLVFSTDSTLLDAATEIDTFPSGSRLTLKICGATGICCSEVFTGTVHTGYYAFPGGASNPCKGLVIDWRAFLSGGARIEMELSGTDLIFKVEWFVIELNDQQRDVGCGGIEVQGNGGAKRVDRHFCYFRMRF